MDEHPYFGDKDNYFPTLKSMTSYNFGPIVVDYDREDYFLFDEIRWELS